MPELPPLSSQEVIRVLEHRGFRLVRSRGSHHLFWNPETARRVTVPIHSGDLPIGTLAEILRQAGISRDDLRDLI
jgi:predicted RNA binding protein YcfA (HicA-like mRNA interferase family)